MLFYMIVLKISDQLRSAFILETHQIIYFRKEYFTLKKRVANYPLVKFWI